MSAFNLSGLLPSEKANIRLGLAALNRGDFDEKPELRLRTAACYRVRADMVAESRPRFAEALRALAWRWEASVADSV